MRKSFKLTTVLMSLLSIMMISFISCEEEPQILDVEESGADTVIISNIDTISIQDSILMYDTINNIDSIFIYDTIVEYLERIDTIAGEIEDTTTIVIPDYYRITTANQTLLLIINGGENLLIPYDTITFHEFDTVFVRVLRGEMLDTLTPSDFDLDRILTY